jgi:hypothetical protein
LDLGIKGRKAIVCASSRALPMQRAGRFTSGQNLQLDGGEVARSRTPEDFAAMLRADLVKWAKGVKAAGIKPE